MIATVEQHIQQGQLAEAVDVLTRSDDSPLATRTDLTMSWVRLARAFERRGQREQAADCYARSIGALQRPIGRTTPPRRAVLIRLGATSCLLQANRTAAAADALGPVLRESGQDADSQLALAETLGLRVGAQSLAAADYESARAVYRLLAEFGDPQNRATATLGAAWAIALAGSDPAAAATELKAFVDSHPTHNDAPRAARAAADCLRRAGRGQEADSMLASLLTRWPESGAALQVILNQSLGGADRAEIADSVAQWLISDAGLGNINQLGLESLQLGTLAAARHDQLAAWDAYVDALVAADSSGQVTGQLLDRLCRNELASHAERLFAKLIVPAEAAKVPVSVREAACQWAGRTQRWSMLALASESESPDQNSQQRTEVIEGLYAESLTQMGRPAAAAGWWNHLVDGRGVDEFPTLLRCAEAEILVGRDIAQADHRVNAARRAAGQDRFELTLVKLLEAEVSIRRAQFSGARSRLREVIDSTESEASLRGRAQWLMGETYYLQQDFVAAIEAYRQVEVLDPGGVWSAVSLIQAGKSFEQLGRTHQAAVCYLGLVERFADSRYASFARERLAAIDPGQSDTSHPNRIIRR